MNLLVDPILLTLPEPGSDEDVIINFVHNLRIWSSELREGTHRFMIAENYDHALRVLNRYPTREAIYELWERADITTIGPGDAFRACMSLLINPFYFDELTLPDSIAVHEDQVQVAPDLVARLHEPVAAAFRETLGYVTYARERTRPALIEELILVTHPINPGEMAQIDAIIETNTGEDRLMTDIPIATTPGDLLRITSLSVFWEDTHRALQWAVDELTRARRIAVGTELLRYHTTEEFNESIRRYRFDSRPDLLAHIFWTSASLLTGAITRRRTNDHHPLENVACNRHDQTNRVWDPWRLWVTRGKPAIRLHYWWCHGEYILSRVVPHEDYDIGPVRNR